MALLDFGESNKFSCWYDVSSRTGKRGKSYRVHLKQDISCSCEFFAQKNTPCKHLLYVYLFVLNLPEDSAVLQQVHLSGSELIEMFSSKVPKSVDNCPKLTPKALLRSTSTVGYMQIPNQPKTPLNKKMTAKPPMPEPQDDPYWIIGKTGNISKCYGCSEELKDGIVLGRMEFDYFPLLKNESNYKYWAAKLDAHYYHADTECIRKRRPNVNSVHTRCETGITPSPETMDNLCVFNFFRHQKT